MTTKNILIDIAVMVFVLIISAVGAVFLPKMSYSDQFLLAGFIWGMVTGLAAGWVYIKFMDLREDR